MPHKPLHAPHMVLVDDRTLAAQSPHAQFLILDFSKKKVLNQDITETLTSLMHLTDSAETAQRYQHNVAFLFSGWDQDRREVYEIPECLAHFQALTAQWPYWVHFIELEGESAAIVVALLASAVPVKKRLSKLKVAATLDSRALPAVLDRLQTANQRLYQHLALPDEQAAATWSVFMNRLSEFFEAKNDD